MKMLTEEQLSDLLGKAYHRGRHDQRNLQNSIGLFGTNEDVINMMHRQMDAEVTQVERIIAGL